MQCNAMQCKARQCKAARAGRTWLSAVAPAPAPAPPPPGSPLMTEALSWEAVGLCTSMLADAEAEGLR